MNTPEEVYVVEKEISHSKTGDRAIARVYVPTIERAKELSTGGATYRSVPLASIPEKAQENMRRYFSELSA
jgi:hypothetical protein